MRKKTMDDLNFNQEDRDRMTRLEAKLDSYSALLAILTQRVDKLEGRVWGFGSSSLLALVGVLFSLLKGG